MPRDAIFGIEEAPVDGKAYGRADTDWQPVPEEAPLDGKSYTRKNATWVEVGTDAPPTLAIEFIVPNAAPIGSPVLTVEAHGTTFTPTTVAVIDGVAVATNYVSATELNFQLNPATEIVRTASITLQDGTVTTPDNAPFYFTEVTVNYGVGLSLDETAVPPQVNLNPAGNTVDVLGGVYVPLRSAEQGLVVETTTGALVVPLATPALAGAIVEPVDDKLYARGGGVTPRWERTVDEAPLDANGYMRQDGGWVPAPTDPVDEKLYARGGGNNPRWERTVDEAPLDAQGYMRSEGGWVPAPTDPVDDKLYARGGGTNPRWERTVDEAPLDDPNKQYARSDGGWTEVTSGGVSVSDDPPATPASNALWWDSNSGAMYLNYTDADSIQWVHVNPTSTGAATITVGDFAPTVPAANQLWWNSNDSNMYLWHNDGTSEQWVQVSGDGVAQLSLSGGTMNGGISFGARVAPDPNNVSQHIALYDGTAKFGMSVTGGRFNYVVTDGANSHFFRVGTSDKLQVSANGVQVTGNVNNNSGNFISNGGGFFCGDIWHGMIFQANVMEFVEYHATFKFYKRTSGTSGGELLATINQAGVVANDVSVRAPAVCAAVQAAELGDLLHDDGDGEQVDLGALAMRMLGEMKTLKADVEALQAKMKTITDLT